MVAHALEEEVAAMVETHASKVAEGTHASEVVAVAMPHASKEMEVAMPYTLKEVRVLLPH